MNRNQINAFLLKFLMKTGRKRTLDVLKNQLQEERKEEPSKSAGVKLSFAIQRPPKRKPLLEVPAIQKQTKKAKIASDDAQLTGRFGSVNFPSNLMVYSIKLTKNFI